jgi:hypothetical protein
LLPPKVLLVMINWLLLKYVLSYWPHLLIDSLTSWFQGHNEDNRVGQQLRLVRVEEVVTSFNKPSVISYSVYLIWEMVILFEFSEFVICDIVIVKQVALVDLDSIALIFLCLSLV